MLYDNKKVVFQPVCPKSVDFRDAVPLRKPMLPSREERLVGGDFGQYPVKGLVAMPDPGEHVLSPPPDNFPQFLQSAVCNFPLKQHLRLHLQEFLCLEATLAYNKGFRILELFTKLAQT